MSYIFRRPVNSDFRKTEEMTKWAVKHCQSYIANDIDKTGNWYYRLYFNNEKEYLMFLLRWA